MWAMVHLAFHWPPGRGREERLMYEYKTITKWAGWWGGWGSENDIADIINEEARAGWRLVRWESMRLFWWWFLPRLNMLFIFERARTAARIPTAPRLVREPAPSPPAGPEREAATIPAPTYAPDEPTAGPFAKRVPGGL